MITLDLIKPFCGQRREDHDRQFLSPWLFGDRIYATNGRVAIRLDVWPEATVPAATDKQARYSKQINAWFTSERTNTIPLPDVPLLHTVEVCSHCNGTSKCPEGGDCCPDGHCDSCISGRVIYGTIVTLGVAFFNSYYLGLLKALPNLEIAVRDPDEMALCWFDGGMCAVMPLRFETADRRARIP